MPESLVVESLNTGLWNPSFDREQIPLLEEIADVDLSDIN